MAAPRPTPTAKSERTRNAVVRALEALIEEGDLTPSAGDIAARAGISLRSVYVHFASVDDLHLAVAERATGRVLTMLWPIDPEAPLTVRIDDLVRQLLGDLAPGGDALRAHQLPPALRQVLRRAERARRAAVVDLVVSGEAWDVLRGAGGLDPSEAAKAVREAVATLLTAGPTADG